MKRLVFALLATCVAGVVRAEAPDDVRVAPILSSRWGQMTTTGLSDGSPCFNYFAPCTNYCGCVAVALGQIMRHYKWPQSAVGTNSFECLVGDDAAARKETFALKGGTYDFANMSFDTSSGTISETTRQAIGKLMHDIAVSCGSEFSSTATLAKVCMARQRLLDTFHFASAEVLIFDDRSFPYRAEIVEKIVRSNCDYGAPVVLSVVNAENFKHEIVVDGYGYDDGVFKMHVNCGANGAYDCWTDLASAIVLGNEAADRYAKIEEIIYNIFPAKTGAIVCGRVLDATGVAVPSATVVVTDEAGVTQTNVTGVAGCYAFLVRPGVCGIRAFKGSLRGGLAAETFVSTSPQFDVKGDTYLDADHVPVIGNVCGVDIAFPPKSEKGSVEPPVINPKSETITNEVTVSILCPTDGATIRYTLNGDEPNETNSVVYTSPFKIHDTTDVKARAWKTGYDASGIAVRNFKRDATRNPFVGDTPGDALVICGASGSRESGAMKNYAPISEAYIIPGMNEYNRARVDYLDCAYHSCWFEWTAPGSGEVKVSACVLADAIWGRVYDGAGKWNPAGTHEPSAASMMGVYTGDDVSSLSCLTNVGYYAYMMGGKEYVVFGVDEPTVAFQAEEGKTYRFQVVTSYDFVNEAHTNYYNRYFWYYDNALTNQQFAALDTFTCNFSWQGDLTSSASGASPDTPEPESEDEKPAAITDYCLINYDENGGVGDVPPQLLFSSGSSATTLVTNVPTRANFTFDGWSTVKDGPAEFAAGTKFPNLIYDGRTVTLYAVWAGMTREVIFDLSCGHLTCADSAMLTQTVCYAQAATEPTLVADANYSLAGWDAPFDCVLSNMTVRARYTSTAPIIAVSHVKGLSACGDVTGPNTNVTRGTTVTLKAVPRSGYYFAGWYTDAAGESPLSGELDYRTATYAYCVDVDVDTTLYARFVSTSDDAVTFVNTTEYGFETGKAIDPIALAALTTGGSLPTFKVKGLPSGLSFDKKKVVIAGTPKKSGVYTATVTATTQSKKTATQVLTFVVRKASESVVRVDCDSARGTVKGAGVYAKGAKVTLKATPATKPQKYVFSGWYDAGGALVSREPSYKFVKQSDGDECYTGVFIDTQSDAAGIAANVAGFSYGEAMATAATNVYAGVYLAWPVAVEALSKTTVKVSGLPSGLKFTAKDIVDKKTKAVTVPANTIYGAPTKGGKTSAVKVAVTTAGKAKKEYVLTTTVAALPEKVVGNFAGGSTNAPMGLATVTIAANGKISGKWISEGKTWKLTASYFDSVSADGVCHAAAIAQCGKVMMTNNLAVADLGAAGVLDTELFRAWWYNAKSTKYKEAVAKIEKLKSAEYAIDESQNLVITFKKNGSAQVAGHAQKVTVVLTPREDGTYGLLAYFAPKGDFKGAAYDIPIKEDK